MLSEKEFIKQIKIVIKKCNIKKSEMYDFKYYITNIFKKQLASDYIYSISINPYLLFKPFVKEYCFKKTKQLILNDFVAEKIKTLTHPGVYMFEDDKNNPLYIGSSKNLSLRIFNSFKENIYNKYNGNLKLSFINTKTESDARILEIFYIVKKQPTLNKEFNINDVCNFKPHKIQKFNYFISWDKNEVFEL